VLQVYCDEAEEAVLDHEALGNSTFISNHLAEPFCKVGAPDFCYLGPVFSLDEANEPHFPHAYKLELDEAQRVEVLLQLMQPLLLELLAALLGADHDKVVLLVCLIE